jgi:REP-associated tyrosine transposase
VNPWGATFHIRIRAKGPRLLTDPVLAPALLESALFYAVRRRWYPHLFLLMPDHIHALISFPPGSRMSQTIGDWKKWHVRTNHVEWQEGYFDHRLRQEESFGEKARYIHNNPVVRGLCTRPEDWQWAVGVEQVQQALELNLDNAAR